MFWPPYWEGNAPELTSDELGWDVIRKREAGSDDTKDIYDYYVGCLGMDLSLYYAEKDKFYYVDMANGEVVSQKENPKWDGKYDYDRVCVYECNGDLDSDEVFDFETAEELWSAFKIDGKPMSYILEHSVIWLST